MAAKLAAAAERRRAVSQLVSSLCSTAEQTDCCCHHFVCLCVLLLKLLFSHCRCVVENIGPGSTAPAQNCDTLCSSHRDMQQGISSLNLCRNWSGQGGRWRTTTPAETSLGTTSPQQPSSVVFNSRDRGCCSLWLSGPLAQTSEGLFCPISWSPPRQRHNLPTAPRDSKFSYEDMVRRGAC